MGENTSYRWRGLSCGQTASSYGIALLAAPRACGERALVSLRGPWIFCCLNDLFFVVVCFFFRVEGVNCKSMPYTEKTTHRTIFTIWIWQTVIVLKSWDFSFRINLTIATFQ